MIELWALVWLAIQEAKILFKIFVCWSKKLAPGVDFLTIDISCPNTKDSLQFSDPQMLLGLLYEVVKTRDQLCEERPTLLLVKFSPDEAASILEQQVEACVKSGIDGFVATNTTTKRPETLTSTVFPDRGGLSGRPLLPNPLKLSAVLRVNRWKDSDYRCGRHIVRKGRLPKNSRGGFFGPDVFSTLL